MSSTTLYRLSGISLLIGSLLTISGFIPDLIVEHSSGSAIAAATALLRLIGLMLVVLGLPGMYAKQAEQVGILGLLGFIVTLFSLLMGMAQQPVFAFINPFLATHAPALLNGRPPQGLLIFFTVGGLLGLVGATMLGIAIMRAAILPRWAGLVLIAGEVFSLIGSFLGLGQSIVDMGVVIFLIGLAWLAVGLWLKRPSIGEASLPTAGVRA
jgi:hypothetical protein